MSDKVAKLEKPFVNRIVGSGVEQTDQLLANPRNWRVHYEAQQQALAGAIDEVGFIRSITVNRLSGAIVDGHLRVILALRSGVAELPVEYVELSEEEEAKALLMLDPIAAMAAADRAKLADLMGMVNSDDARVQAMLAELAEKEGVFGNGHEPKDAPPETNRAEKLRQAWGIELGQLWRIGDHLLLCGDSTKREDVERVMGGEKAGAVVTDSPYGIEREGIENDDPEGLRGLFDGVLAAMPIENAVVINFQSPRLFPVWLDAIRAAGYKFERMLWMYKSNDETRPWRGWIMTSEAILVSSIGDGEWIDVHPYSHDCYRVEWGKDEVPTGIHASVKPLAVVQDLVSRVGGNVYDPFLGSGTTMVACQNLGRKCRGIEISEGYCGVVLERMKTAFPGIQIELLERA